MATEYSTTGTPLLTAPTWTASTILDGSISGASVTRMSVPSRLPPRWMRLWRWELMLTCICSTGAPTLDSRQVCLFHPWHTHLMYHLGEWLSRTWLQGHLETSPSTRYRRHTIMTLRYPRLETWPISIICWGIRLARYVCTSRYHWRHSSINRIFLKIRHFCDRLLATNLQLILSSFIPFISVRQGLKWKAKMASILLPVWLQRLSMQNILFCSIKT